MEGDDTEDVKSMRTKSHKKQRRLPSDESSSCSENESPVAKKPKRKAPRRRAQIQSDDESNDASKNGDSNDETLSKNLRSAIYEGDSADANQVSTPINSKNVDNRRFSRSSARLRRKREIKGTMELPKRQEVFDQISPPPKEKEFCRKEMVKQRHVNNFFREKSTYNTDRLETYISEDDCEDDFIVDDDESDEEPESESSANVTPKKKAPKRLRNRQKKCKVSSSSSSEENIDNDSRKVFKQRKLKFDESESSTEGSEIELNVSGKKEKHSLILRSESEDDENQNESVDEGKLLPRRRNKEKEKIGKAAAALRKKRELARSNLPLDRRRYLEKEIDNEFSSEIEEQLDENIEIIGINDADVVNQEDIDEFTLRDSDKEFIVSDFSSADEQSHVKIERDFETCIENLRHSGDYFPHVHTAKTDKNSAPDDKKSLAENRLQYHRVLLEYDSDDDMSSKQLTDLFKNLRRKDCDVSIVKCLIKRYEGLLASVDNHGRSPLHVATIAGNLEAVTVLLENGANANSVDRKNLPSVAYAAYWKHPQALKRLLKETNLAAMHRLLHKNFNGMSLLHLILLDSKLSFSEDVQSRQLECLRVVKECHSIMYKSLLDKADRKQLTPVLLAIVEGQEKCVKVLLENDESLRNYRTDMEGTVLHLSVIYSRNYEESHQAVCLEMLLSHFKDMVDVPDKNGFTPLLYAAENGNSECMKTLLEHGATVDLQDDHGTSALHLAAAIGSTECVQLLLSHGHPVDILDDCGWPPLLYANFQSCESCVVELMKAKPKQLFVLSSLLKDCDPQQKEKNMQVVKNTILSLANQDAYYKIFNDFIRQNIELLDEFNYGIFMTTWKAILDFENKQTWFRRRLAKLRKTRQNGVHLTARRDSVLKSAMTMLEGLERIDIQHLSVDFFDEPGICTGPKKEFLACLCNEIILPKMKLFTQIDNQQYSPSPLHFFADVMWSKCNAEDPFSSIDTAPSTVKKSKPKPESDYEKEAKDSNEVTKDQVMSIKVELREKLRALRFIGRLVAACIADGWYLSLQLSKTFIKQILGQNMQHPDDLQSFDHSLYNGAVKSTLENSVEDLDLPFSISCANPWLESGAEEVSLSKIESVLTDKNKIAFVLAVSKFKLCDSIDREVKAFKSGFYKEINQDMISIFTTGEFSLLMNGIQYIDVKDWKENTVYGGWHPDDNEIIWFWKTVEGLKQEEKALLLKFSTGSPCVPIGGFKELEGLNGKTRFSISKTAKNTNSIPTAATCFNVLRLSSFSSEKELREKVLIALRHGSEGFAFS